MLISLLRFSRKGFTLIEVLIVSCIVLAVSVTASVSLYQGIRIYNRLIELSQEEQAAFFFEKATQDIKNTINFSAQPFLIDGTSLTLTSMKRIGVLSQSTFSAIPHLVRYQFDADGSRIIRIEKAPYNRQYNREDVLLSRVRSFHIRSGPDASDGSIPDWVEVEFAFESGHQYKKTITIPIQYAPSV